MAKWEGMGKKSSRRGATVEDFGAKPLWKERTVALFIKENLRKIRNMQNLIAGINRIDFFVMGRDFSRNGAWSRRRRKK